MPDLNEMRDTILRDLRGISFMLVWWLPTDTIRFRSDSNKFQALDFRVQDVVDGHLWTNHIVPWGVADATHALRYVRPQLVEYLALRDGTNTPTAPAETTTPYIPQAATPAPQVRTTPAPVQKKAEVTKPAPTPAPKRDGKLPKAFLSLDLPSPQEALPITPFTPRASPDTYTSVRYHTRPKSRASFRSGKNPWTIPSLEIY